MAVVIDPQPPGRLRRLSASLSRFTLRSAVVFGLLLLVLAGALLGPKGAAFIAIMAVGTTVVALAGSGLMAWLGTDDLTGDVAPHGHGVFLRDLADRATRTRTREVITATVLIGVTVLIAAATAEIGDKAMLLLIMVMGLIGVIATVRNRSLMFMFVLAASFSLIWYKKFTPILADHYAVAIYITTVDAVLLFAYGVWASEGTLYADLKKGLKNPVYMLPFAGIAVGLLSSINALDQRLVWAEIVRYGFMALLFIYCGIRIRRREHIWAVMLGWLVFLGVQAMVAVSQYVTKGFLGIEQFRLKPDPYQPLSAQPVRPYGTQIHPNFLACVVGMACLMLACFALHIPKGKLMRYLMLMCVPLSAVLAVVSRARGSLVALVPAVIVVLVFSVRRRLVSGRVVLVVGLLCAIGAVATPQVAETARGMFSSSGSDLVANWKIRWQINEVAFNMIRSEPLVGVGLNSFVGQVKNYRVEETIFEADPAHNIYLLTAAETGLLGLGMLVLIASVYVRYAYLLTRTKDPMYQSIGIGALGSLVYIAFEEFNSFSLKQDIPLAMFWTTFGLVMAATQMAKADLPPLPYVQWFKPGPLQRGGDAATVDESPVPERRAAVSAASSEQG